MGHPDYFDAVERAAAFERDAAPWLLIRLPGEPCVYVANWRCNAMRRETERLNAERRELRQRHLASIVAPKLTF